MDFSRDTVFRLYSEVSYPGPYPLRAPWLPTPSDRNVTNAPENIVRTKREKIVTHYNIPHILHAWHHMLDYAMTGFSPTGG